MYNGDAMLYILGLGVEPLEHATIETLQALGRCDVIWTQGLTLPEQRFLRRFAPKGKWRVLPAREAGERWADLLARDLKAGRVVAWATRGHPFYWNAVAARLVAAAKQLKISWQTYGAVSPMGLALADMGVALGDEVLGLQSFDIAALNDKGIVVNPEWPLVLYSYASLSPQGFSAALRLLLRRYPASHPVEWRRGAGRGERLRLGDLAKTRVALDNVSILCLPALRRSKSKLGRTSEKPMTRTPEAASRS